jgi:hypothetical protein
MLKLFHVPVHIAIATVRMSNGKIGSGSIYRSHHKGVGHGVVGPFVKKKGWRKRVPDDAECKIFSEIQNLLILSGVRRAST